MGTASRGLLLRGVGGDRAAWSQPFDQGVVIVLWSLPFDQMGDFAAGSWSQPFDIGDIGLASWVQPFDLSGTMFVAWDLPFAMLDATTGQEAGAVLAPEIGYYDPTPVVVPTYDQMVWSTPGIVAYLMMETAGTYIADAVGGVHTPLTGGPPLVAGPLAYDPGSHGMSFDGSTQFGRLRGNTPGPSRPELDWGLGDFTIEFWVKPGALPAADRVIFGRSGDTSVGSWDVYRTATGTFAMRLRAFTTGFTGVISQTAWHLLQYVADRDVGGKWTVDNVPGSQHSLAGVAAYDIVSTTLDFNVMRDSGGLLSAAALSRAAFYKRALTPAELSSRWARGHG